MTAPSFAPDPARVLSFLRHCPAYEPTPLRTFSFGGEGELLVKDETGRMGLGAFKALGGPYAVARLVAHRWEAAFGTALPLDAMQDPAVRVFASGLTFVCASAGNHGMAVAAGARHVGARARVHLAATVSRTFADRLTAMGAEVVQSGAVYEDSMAAAGRDANRPDHILLADASWPGHARAPALVMEGYTVLAEELRAAFCESSRWPTHVFVQAGVGGLAAAMAHMIRTSWPVQPRIVIVEPEAAPCLLHSHRAGRPVVVEGPVSAMGRLDCKEPSHIAFDVLQSAGVDYALVSEGQADRAREQLRRTYGITTTPSGAAGFAALQHVAGEAVGGPRRPLVVVTEGVP